MLFFRSIFDVITPVFLLFINFACQPASPKLAAPAEEKNAEEIVAPDAPVTLPGEPLIVPPLAPPLVPVAHGGGGGSQGALHPAATGNPDDFIDDIGGFCGNGIQELLSTSGSRCQNLLYGTTTDGPNGSSGLYYIDPATGQGYLIGLVSGGVERVGAIDFNPQGMLFGVGEITGSNLSAFLAIDCRTGLASIVGRTGIESLGAGATITDIDFDPEGRLFAFARSNLNPNILGSINPVTGTFTAIGPAGPAIDPNEAGNGIASAPFPTSVLYHAGETNLSVLNTQTGMASNVEGLEFHPPADVFPRINALDFKISNATIYAAINSDSANYVGILDPESGDVSFLFTPPLFAPEGLDGLAVNQRYEECDGTTDPIGGTGCSADCMLTESTSANALACSDGEDNDFDGLIDCEDPDCNLQVCDDGLFCTLNDTCNGGVCATIPNACDDNNSCTLDSCVEAEGDIPGFCVSVLDPMKTDFGACELDGNPCTAGKCVEVVDVISCFEQGREFLPAPTGCLDEEICTADSCVVTPDDDDEDELDEFQCLHETLAGQICVSESECSNGVCIISGTGMPGSPFAIDCVEVDIPSLTAQCPGDNNPCTAESCVEGDGCISTPLMVGTICSDNDACTLNDSCQIPVGGGTPLCIGTPKATTPSPLGCADTNLCTVDSCNPDGSCLNTTPADQCDNDTFCRISSCDSMTGGCAYTNVNEGQSCDDGDNCTINSTCVSGICTSVTPLDCEELIPNVCTLDSCDISGCVHTPLNGPVGPTCEVAGSTSTPPTVFGICTTGAQQCDDGTLMADMCVQLYRPGDKPEDCDNGLDDDCDGLIDIEDVDDCTLLAFVTAATFNGNLGGITGADALCQTQADGGTETVGRTFVAWISDSTADAIDPGRVDDQGRAYLRTDGVVIANSHADLIDGSLDNPISLDQNGVITGTNGVWTGTGTNGLIAGRQCGNWNSTVFVPGGSFGLSTFTTAEWTFNLITSACANELRLYCFERPAP